ncbi:pancreatic adenocarcinoma up-regulated factor [Pteronotus mesoamericanus]|uniref:pancreatic adenocarcinoma up-regulated factor n=1 Tax=Pteronotus mesoamericanus TaxID=1884717 RepID=UPI0023EC4348|nr:zymogen granule protein 16 homolog B [Pteronotus parnellii mesoamericanus]
MGAHRARKGIKGQVEGALEQDSRVPGLGDRTFLARSLGTHQPEIMLLWLTLTILWSTICWAEQMYGNGGGWYFSTSTDNENDITGIRVSTGLIGIIKSIQVRYGSSWSERYGVSGGHAQEFVLWPGEHIIGVYGSHKIYLRYLIMYTDFGRWATFGKEEGRSFVVYPNEPGNVLRGLFGQYQSLGITSIGFNWDQPLVELVTEQPSNKTT